ncbi:urea transport system ATP-binding protein [Ketogulonicigenium robustum]|uniref:Urea transport system ATP-binding protein n=1 Tax=Ketogulonicigenium robustum TaxID=92947 RepID=A0A1W6P1S1_9RHOB|nr:ABC transporter ATP-binding protein [Ketogulonicigenium robustum]ARO15280.1 urea transport system ATP-binding protein [Ketogulonicigenium robustum]
MTAASLTISGLTAGYSQTRILEDIDLSVPAGGRTAVLGRNGMGKTTLFASIAGQTRRHGGTIRLDNTELTALDGAARARAGLGYVPQNRAIFRSLTVEENLLSGLKDRPRSAIEEAYTLFPRLAERRQNMGGQLSGGEQQMLTTARTILGQPRLLMLDEPLEGLAPVICDALMEAFTQLAASGTMTILLVEQRLKAAFDFADTIVILERGRVAWQGTSAALQADTATIDRLLGVGH